MWIALFLVLGFRRSQICRGDLRLIFDPLLAPFRAGGHSGELIAAADLQALQQDHDADHSSGSRVMEEDGAGAGAVENQGTETEQPSDPSRLGDAQGLMASQACGNQLTLSFQGEVFVFDFVSPEKVKAVLLLLGVREMPTGVNPFPTSSTQNRRLNVPHRVASLMRFRKKRQEQNFGKKICYTVRKEVALRMQWNRGQFTSSKTKTEDAMGTTRDLLKNPSPAIPNALPERKEGKHSANSELSAMTHHEKSAVLVEAWPLRIVQRYPTGVDLYCLHFYMIHPDSLPTNMVYWVGSDFAMQVISVPCHHHPSPPSPRD
ncbi:gata transcription factor [Musa troglodytarum]|uniref:Gata transcription factor n=1 Tax=Musa troglodytarum TaxID=320322 RepID=A0A9E7H6C3_9LILI|nr:gata transcription factor [Musa troglodytarum]